MSKYSDKIYKFHIDLDFSAKINTSFKVYESFIHNVFKPYRPIFNMLFSHQHYTFKKNLHDNLSIDSIIPLRKILTRYFPNTIRNAFKDIFKKPVEKIIRNDKYDKVAFKEEFKQFYKSINDCIDSIEVFSRTLIIFHYNSFINDIVHYILADNNYSDKLTYNNFVNVDCYSILHPELVTVMVEDYRIYTLQMPKFINDISDNLSYRRFTETIARQTYLNNKAARETFLKQYENHNYNIKRDLNLIYLLEFTLDIEPYKIIALVDIIEVYSVIKDNNTILFGNDSYDIHQVTPIEYISNADDLIVECKYYYGAQFPNHPIMFTERAFSYNFRNNKFDIKTWRIKNNE